MMALHGSACSADLDYLNSSTPKVPICGTQRPLVANLVEEKKKKTFESRAYLLAD